MSSARRRSARAATWEADTSLAKWDEAIEDFQKALSLQQESIPEIFLNLGLVYIEKGDFEKALEWLNKGLDIYPENAEMLMFRGEAFEGMGKKDLAEKDYEKAIELKPELEKEIRGDGDNA